MPRLTLLVGPPGSGKSTFAKDPYYMNSGVYVNQDSQKGDHMDIFFDAVAQGKDILVDRMNFNKQQRAKYIDYAKFKNPAYEIKIIVLHQPYQVCLDRIRNRFGQHETINDEKAARGALKTFFGQYERPQPDEANMIEFRYPEGPKPSAVVCDLDGTLCNIEHRRHHVRPPLKTEDQFLDEVVNDKKIPFKKDWAAFYRDIPKDTINRWCAEILHTLKGSHSIVLCSGRDTNQQTNTVIWLQKHEVYYDALYMRDRTDSRQDYIVKEIILDFEILTRYTPYFMIDDRQQVVDMWRKRGFTCLQCDVGDF